MKGKKILALCACVLAGVAVAGGLCFFFLAQKPVDSVPESVNVIVVDNEFCLEAEYGGQGLSYEFCLEEKFGDQFVVIEMVKSKTNNIKLSDCNLQLAEGKTFRFAARYVNENKKGKFSKTFEWTV